MSTCPLHLVMPSMQTHASTKPGQTCVVARAGKETIVSDIYNGCIGRPFLVEEEDVDDFMDW